MNKLLEAWWRRFRDPGEPVKGEENVFNLLSPEDAEIFGTLVAWRHDLEWRDQNKYNSIVSQIGMGTFSGTVDRKALVVDIRRDAWKYRKLFQPRLVVYAALNGGMQRADDPRP